MSEPQMSYIEERLFLLLDNIEGLSKQTEKQQLIIEQMIEREKAQKAKFTNEIEAIKKASVRHFALLENQTAKLQGAMIDVVSDNIAKGIHNASAEVLEHNLGNVLKNFEKEVQVSAKQLVHATSVAKTIADETIQEYQKYFGWKAIALGVGTVILTLLIALTAFFLYVPSKTEISDRRAAVALLKKQQVTIGQCAGQTCVKVNTSKCNYGQEKHNTNYRYCLVK